MRRFLQFALLAAFLLAAALPAPAATKSKKRVAPTADSDDNPYAQILPVGVPSVRAASVVVIDAKTGEVLYEKNASQHRPPASTQKLLTALVLAETGNLQKPVEVEPIDTQCEPVKLGFKPGETYTRQDLLEV